MAGNAMDWINDYLKSNWLMWGIIGGISGIFYVTKYKGLFNTPPQLHLITALIGLAAAGYGYMLTHNMSFNTNVDSGYTYYHDGYYYFG